MRKIKRKMHYQNAAAKALALPLLVALASCGQAPDGGGAAVYEGARLIIGDGSGIENGSLVVENGQITAVGATGQVAAPAGAEAMDLSGMTIIPALVDTHVHMGTTREDLLNDLRRRA